MRIGVVFPQTEMAADPGAVKAFAQAAEDLGFTHLLAYDHVLGASTANRPDFRGPYTSDSSFHEVFVLFGFLAGVTEHLELVTGVLILPQRQTALVAKQTAEIDVLSKGRLRLGIGVGWNDVEFTGLGESFRNRGKRSEEQIEVLRRLWTEDVIDFEGQWHRIPQAGIRPLPVRRPIPVWLGGYVPATFERTGRMGDGYFPSSQQGEGPTDAVRANLETIRDAAKANGRDPAEIGIEPRIRLPRLDPDSWAEVTGAWAAEEGISHLSVITMDGDEPLDVDGHIALLRAYREAVPAS